MDSFPSSKNKKQCISKCYDPYSQIFHPILNKYVSKDTPFCLLNDMVYNPEDSSFTRIFIDECTKDKDKLLNKDPELVLSVYQFNKQSFLNKYDISSLDDFLNWYSDNKYTPYLTKKRIINILLNNKYDFLNKDENYILATSEQLFYDIIIEFIIESIKKYWIRDIYYVSNPYITINKDKSKC
jgi:hypothetical protein